MDFKEIAKQLCEKDRKLIGEWAWEKTKEDFYFEETKEHWLAWQELSDREKKRELKKMPEEPPDGNISYLSIATACLGSAEVKKRLGALK